MRIRRIFRRQNGSRKNRAYQLIHFAGTLALITALLQLWLSTSLVTGSTHLDELAFTPEAYFMVDTAASVYSKVPRYHELEEEILRISSMKSPGRYTMPTAFSQATVVRNETTWFKPKKICNMTCCVETVAVSLDQDTFQIISNAPLDLADIVFHRGERTIPEWMHYQASFFTTSMLPCFQPGTIFWIEGTSKFRAEYSTNIKDHVHVPHILFTSKSDSDSPNRAITHLLQSDDRLLLKWYGTNPTLNLPAKEDPFDKFVPYPLGLSIKQQQAKYLYPYLEMTNYSNPFWSKERWLSHKDDISADDIFVKFGINDASPFRQWPSDSICRHQETHDGVSCSLNYTEASTIYSSASRYLFGLSPPGAGWDCYRTYEWLILGVIPIVEYRGMAPKLFQGLPVVFVPKMVDKTETNTMTLATLSTYLDAARAFINSEEFQTSRYHGWDRLFLKYWRRKILEDAGRTKDIVQDELGRQFYQAWKYTLT